MSTVRKRPGHQRLTGVTYDTYTRLRAYSGNRGVRMAYHDGVLEIMSPELRHDRPSFRLMLLVVAYCEAFGVTYDLTGSATVRGGIPGRRKGHGKEPDQGVYLRDAAEAVAAQDAIDLATCPPPSLWVEVDNWGSSKAKLPLYAALKVPEVWRYRARSRKLRFGRLSGDHYEEIDASEALPGLTPEVVLDLLGAFKGRPTSAWKHWLETEWLPAHRQELMDRGAGR